jgi:superfamily II DNA or RNA helicase
MSQFRTVKIKLLDEVNAVIVGLTPDHLLYFYEDFARFAPNHFFNPKSKLGSWDGKIRYFHKTGKTYTYLLNDIIPKLSAFGYKLNLIDQRIGKTITPPLIDKDYFSHIEDPETGEPIQFRPYQVDLVNSLIENAGGIALAGTGAGKTICNAALVDSYGKMGLKTITIVPNQDLIEQTRTDFLYWGLDTGEYSGDCKDIKHQHVVSTWQALQNNPKIISEFQLVVVDECHGLKGQVLTKLLNEHGHNISYRFGLTGTLPKAATDAMAVRIAVGDVQYSITAAELIKQGWLASLHINIMQLEEDFTEQYERYLQEYEEMSAIAKSEHKKLTYIQFKDSYFPEYSAEKGYLQTNNERLEWIKMYIEAKRDVGKGNVFCLVDGVNFGKKLAKLIPGAIFVHGKDKKKARKEVYQLFKENDNLVVIATVQIASVGLNIKRIFNLMFIDVGKSFIRVIQTIGRGLRKAPDKDHVDVTDICSDLKYGKKHVRDRIKFYKEAEYPYKKRKVDYTN